MGPISFLDPIRRSYAAKFLVALVAITIVVGAFGAYMYVHVGDELRSDVRSDLADDSSQEAERLDVWFQSTEQHVTALTRSNAVRSQDQYAISDALHRTTERAAIEGAYIVDADTGEVRVAAGSTGIHEDGRVSDRVQERLQRTTAADERVAFTDAFETSGGSAAMLVVGRTPSDDGRLVVGLVDLESLSGYMLGDGTEEELVVLDRDGTVVLAQNEERLLSRGEIDPGTLEGESGVSSASIGGKDTEVGYASFENTGWTLTSRASADAAYSLQTDVSRQILLLIGVVLGSVLLLGATIGRNTAGSLRELSDRASEIEDGALDREIESDRRDELGELYRSVDAMRRSLRERIEEAERSRAAAEEARAASEQRRAHLERTADEYGETMRSCAAGDLTERLDPDPESEAMTRIAEEFNEMMDDIEDTVRTTRRFAALVDDASESTADSVAEVRAASEQVTTSIQEIADGADRQSDQLEAVVAEMDDLSSMTEEITATADEVASLAERTADTSAEARSSAREAIAGLDELETESTEAVEEVEKLEAEMAEIDELLEFITDVSRETNMLALNASIEASRGDGSGGEFSAVAEEVKELATETKEATEDVEARLERVTTQTDSVVAVVRETSDRIATHQGAVEETVAALEDIATYAERTNDGIQDIADATERQASLTASVVEQVEDTASIGEELSAEAETVAAAAEEQTSSIVEVAQHTEVLAEQATALSEALDEFDVDPSEERSGDGESVAELPGEELTPMPAGPSLEESADGADASPEGE